MRRLLTADMFDMSLSDQAVKRRLIFHHHKDINNIYTEYSSCIYTEGAGRKSTVTQWLHVLSRNATWRRKDRLSFIIYIHVLYQATHIAYHKS